MKKRQVILYIFVMLILITTSVYATISAELGFDIKLNNKTIYPGDEISVTLRLKNLDTDKEIKAVEGFIDVKSNILEALTVDNIVTNEDGKVEIDENNILKVYDSNDISSTSETGIIFNNKPLSEKGDYKIIVNFDKPVTEDTDLVTIKFKVKEDAEPGSYESAIVYNLFEIFANDASEKAKLDRAGITVEIKEKSNSSTQKPDNNDLDNQNNVGQKDENVTNGNNQSDKPNNQNPSDETKNSVKAPVTFNSVNKTGSGITNTSYKVGSEVDNTVSPTNLPKTGVALIVLPIVIIAIVGIVFYNKYSKYNYHE